MNRLNRILAATLGAICASVSVSAYAGFQPLDTVLQMMTSFFAVPSIANENVQIMLVRFGLFLIVFAAGFSGLKKSFKEKRIAGTIAFVVAFLGAFLMPERLLLVTGGTLSGIIATGLILGIFGYAAYYAVAKLNDGPVQHFMGFLLLILVLWFLSFYAALIGVVGGGVDIGTSNAATVSARQASGTNVENVPGAEDRSSYDGEGNLVPDPEGIPNQFIDDGSDDTSSDSPEPTGTSDSAPSNEPEPTGQVDEPPEQEGDN